MCDQLISMGWHWSLVYMCVKQWNMHGAGLFHDSVAVCPPCSCWTVAVAATTPPNLIALMHLKWCTRIKRRTKSARRSGFRIFWGPKMVGSDSDRVARHILIDLIFRPVRAVMGWLRSSNRFLLDALNIPWQPRFGGSFAEMLGVTSNSLRIFFVPCALVALFAYDGFLFRLLFGTPDLARKCFGWQYCFTHIRHSYWHSHTANHQHVNQSEHKGNTAEWKTHLPTENKNISYK